MPARLALPRSALAGWRWAAVPFGAVYLILLFAQFASIVSNSNLDADTVSAQVIGQLFGSAPAHAHVVLGEFGWYSTLLFELATKWLPAHRQIWEAAPYALALAGFALTAWSVWQVAGRFAASLTAVLLVCTSPATLHLLLSMTQHAPDWFCLGLLAAFLALVEGRGQAVSRPALTAGALVAGLAVGVNAAGDPLVVIAGLAPFVVAVAARELLGPRPHDRAAIAATALMLVITAIAWAGTAIAMSGLDVKPESGLHTTALASGDKIAVNFKLWWQSVAVLGNGDFFGHSLTFTSGLAVICAVISLTAVALLARLGWRALGLASSGAAPAPAAPRMAVIVYWCASAVFLTIAFLLSAIPVDIHADRYLVGLVYAGAAVIPIVAIGRRWREAVVLAATCVFALGGLVALAQGVTSRNTEGFPPVPLAERIARIAAANHVRVGYAGYWDAAPITWATRFRIQVFPVSICDQGTRLCRFDLHYISSWYEPRPAIASFLLADARLALVSAPTPDLGRPSAVYRVGQITMYVYPYDLASRIVR